MKIVVDIDNVMRSIYASPKDYVDTKRIHKIVEDSLNAKITDTMFSSTAHTAMFESISAVDLRKQIEAIRLEMLEMRAKAGDPDYDYYFMHEGESKPKTGKVNGYLPDYGLSPEILKEPTLKIFKVLKQRFDDYWMLPFPKQTESRVLRTKSTSAKIKRMSKRRQKIATKRHKAKLLKPYELILKSRMT